MKEIGIYKITFFMQTPIALSSPLHFDGLLTAVHPAMHNTTTPTRYSKNIPIIDAPLPLCNIRSKNRWVWGCTAAEFPNNAKLSQDSITKRRTPQDIFNAMRSFLPGSGPMKDKFSTFQIVSTPTIYFLAATTELKELTRLTKRIQNIGGKRKSGYGIVSKFEIEPVDATIKDLLVLDGNARRNLPFVFCNNNIDDAKMIPCNSPYWHPASTEQGIEVGDPIELTENIEYYYGRGERYAI